MNRHSENKKNIKFPSGAWSSSSGDSEICIRSARFRTLTESDPRGDSESHLSDAVRSSRGSSAKPLRRNQKPQSQLFGERRALLNFAGRDRPARRLLAAVVERSTLYTYDNIRHSAPQRPSPQWQQCEVKAGGFLLSSALNEHTQRLGVGTRPARRDVNVDRLKRAYFLFNLFKSATVKRTPKSSTSIQQVRIRRGLGLRREHSC